MASKLPQPTTYAEEFDAKYPNWIYQIPGVFLMIGGFGGLAVLSLF